MKLTRISFLLLLVFLFVSEITAQTEGFSKDACISRWTKEVDSPYRLSLSKATVRCNAVEKRIKSLSKQILGKWQRRDGGRTFTMQFFADGTVIRDGNEETWTIENGYGELGGEGLYFNGDNNMVNELRIVGATMTISSNSNYRYTDVERWKRIK